MKYGSAKAAFVVAALAAAMPMLTACASGNGGAGGGSGGVGGGGGMIDDGGGDGGMAPVDLATGGAPPATLDGNRDRLLATYLAYLQAHPGAQSNGLDGATLGSVCDLWSRLDAVGSRRVPHAHGTHAGLGARLRRQRRCSSHVVRLYRLVGGQSATATSAGSCGGGEYNRMIMSMDAGLHTALVAANDHQGAAGSSGAFDLADVAADPSRYWRDSHDVGGPHAPFDLSDETNDGAPRGQVQYFRDPSSAAANAPLGRMDLTTLVDPSALEMDQDYDCVHNSNPSCSYITYGPLCAPEAAKLGVDLYQATYGAIEPAWRPAGC